VRLKAAHSKINQNQKRNVQKKRPQLFDRAIPVGTH